MGRAAGCVDLYLVSRRAQAVPIAALGTEVRFAAGEAIHTDSSYKYGPAEIAALADGAGLSVAAAWTDRRRRFASLMLRRSGEDLTGTWRRDATVARGRAARPASGVARRSHRPGS